MSSERKQLSRRSSSARKQQRSIYQVHYGLRKHYDDTTIQPYFVFVNEMSRFVVQRYSSQVAGHCTTENNKYLGLLQCNGTVLKPIQNEQCRRERSFYEYIYSTQNKELLELQNYVPTYYGCKKFIYNGCENDYIILNEITYTMLEPCIMDVKIGRRTWDPKANDEKIQREKLKYNSCKRDVAFCIPGFQVYTFNGKMYRFGKEYGKKLNGETVKEAFRIFLNAQSTRLCRTMILNFLTELWKIQKWASKQTSVKLYSSSILLTYDAKRLRDCCTDTELLSSKFKSKCCLTPSIRSKPSSQSLKSLESSGSNFSGQLTNKGPSFTKIKPVSSLPPNLARDLTAEVKSEPTPWHEALTLLKRSHSFHNNYEENLSMMKLNYQSQLKDLSSNMERYRPWVKVKIIDFVHAFFNEEEKSIDNNFLEGIDNLVNVFEEFLHETEENG